MSIIMTAPSRYKVYSIPKRSGLGTRLIAQPARELKVIQRYIARSLLWDLPVHPAAMAYVSGLSIRDNALPHCDNRVIMKLDFSNFFHSLVFRDLDASLRRNNFVRIPRNEWLLMESALFWDNPRTGRRCLSIGAPSSPFISNVIMEPLDRKVSAFADRAGATYTRYADDITLSASDVETLMVLRGQISRLIERSARPHLRFNPTKGGIFTSAGRRVVTGLVLTSDGKVSLGRARKRKISAAVHHIAIGRNRTDAHMSVTKGWLAHAKSVDPDFFGSMVEKYGRTVQSIMEVTTPRRQRF